MRKKFSKNVAHTTEKKNAYKILVGNLQGSTPLGRPRCRCDDNLKMELT
jgi:hypothetical protein